jgi:hypothetical protein
MIDGQVMGLPAAILTRMFIPPQDFALGKTDLETRAPDQVTQFYYRGHIELG